MTDNHVHSSFSGDSDMDAVSACDAAIAAGLDGIAFTDHLDIDFPYFDVKFNIDFYKYSDYMDRIKEKYNGRLNIIKGIEAGIMPHVADETLEIVRAHDFDFVIGSVHIIDGMDPYRGDYYIGKTKKHAYERYLAEILDMLGCFDSFDVLGHFDYIVRSGSYEDRSLRYADYSELLDEIFKKLISSGKGIEINTGSYRDKPGIRTPVFDPAALSRYRELGGSIITIGSDAHCVEYVGYKIEYFIDMLKSIGFKYLAHFKKRTPVFELL